jgi:hypothetical protein
MNQTFTLAVPQPMLPPTAEEIRAREYTVQQFGKPLSRKRIRELKKMGKQKPAPEKPDPLIEAKKAEIEQLQRELADEGVL